jgi:hypothetical protein
VRTSLVGIGLSVLALALPAAGGPLYDVRFDSDPLGELPSLSAGGLPRTGPSAIPFGTPRVRESVGAMATRPLEFNRGSRPGFLEQIQFDLGFGSTVYDIEFDVVIVNLVQSGLLRDNFGFHLDYLNQPTVQGAMFLPGGGLEIFDITSGVTFGYQDVYDAGVPFHVSIHADVAAGSWSLRLDDALVHEGALHAPEGDLFMARISLNDRAGLATSLAGLDNVLITTPEPSSAVLMGAALGLLALGRRTGRIRSEPTVRG